MQLRRFEINPVLVPYIDSIWLFESESGIPSSDMRLVVPNARPKITITFRGNLVSKVQGITQVHPTASIIAIGMMETPVTIDSLGAVGTIGIEFKSAAAYCFFGQPLKDITNAVYSLETLWGNVGRDWEAKIAEAVTIEAKVRCIQALLWQRLRENKKSHILITAAVHSLEASNGSLRIADICRELGYSKRYLDMKFAEQIGLSPKMLGRILRFQTVYKRWGHTEFWYPDFDDAYYDQAHFIKEFKQFTGFAPVIYSRLHNEFGRIFYRR